MKNVTGLKSGRFSLYLFIWFFLCGAGCSIVGRVVPVDNRIVFTGQDSGQGIFRSGDLSVNYSYKLKTRRMELKGLVQTHEGFDSLDVRIRFIDAEGAVLNQKIVYSSGYRVTGSRDAERTFQVLLDVPTDAAGISFTYSSQSRYGRQ